MKIALLGVTGRTGKQLLTAALDHGHELTVLVRDPEKLDPAYAERVRVVVGDSTDSTALQDLLKGADVVVSALGPIGRQPDLHTETARALVKIMEDSGPRRFVGVSAAGVDAEGDQKPFRDKIISKFAQTFAGAVAKDKAAELAVWSASDLDWTLVRPPRVLDGPASGVLEYDAHRSTRSMKITCADLAAFLLEVVEKDLFIRQAPFVASAAA